MPFDTSASNEEKMNGDAAPAARENQHGTKGTLPTPSSDSSSATGTEARPSKVEKQQTKAIADGEENGNVEGSDTTNESVSSSGHQQEFTTAKLEGVNPQDATLPSKSSINMREDREEIQIQPRESRPRRSRRKRREDDKPNPDKIWHSRRNWKKRKGGHLVRLASVDSDEGDPSIGRSQQYRVTLKRRAIHKADEELNISKQPSSTRGSPDTQQRRNFRTSSAGDSPGSKKETSDDDDNDELEEYGDVTLGMKLVILGGKVIVQHLNSLSDGRASPAQLAGVVRRGDVLLSIDNVSIVKLKIEQLADALKPLSSPDASTDAYKRSLNLCFAAGEGLKLLKKSESSASKIAALAASTDTAGSDVFSLFPMVDQLSGMPMFEDFGTNVVDLLAGSSDQGEQTKQSEESPPPQPADESIVDQHDLAVDKVISRTLADQRLHDRAKYTSAYYSWNSVFSELLRPSQASVAALPHRRQNISKVTRAQILQRGMKALFGASKVTQNLSNLDRGKDMRSFKHWNTTLSLRSRASSRRKFLLEVTSLPAGLRIDKLESHSDDDSIVTNASEDYEGIDPDELLLRLAAHDDIWRKQVLSTLEDAVHDMENDNDSDGEKENNAVESLSIPDIDAAISQELGSFLFGEQMAKIVSKRKKTFVLPPTEVTSVLFDLVTQLVSTRPDEVAVIGGSSISAHASLLQVPKSSYFRSDVKIVLAMEFVLTKALSIWLKTFRPLPWEQRRVLWPYVQQATGDANTLASMTHHSDDSLTVDSGLTASPNSSPRQRRNLREVIEDMELDVEARAEVCFLVSYFFTEGLLPKLRTQSSEKCSSYAIDDIVEFAKSYGAYLQLHTCLAHATAIEADGVIEVLLDLAKHDPRHLEAMKQLSKSNALLLYDPSMLSAIMQRLRVIRHDKRAELRRSLITLAASAYPDVLPWQLRVALLSVSSAEERNEVEDLSELYYEYLSLLLHPLHGNRMARRDASLIQEWCKLSVESKTECFKRWTKEKRRENFFAVASRSSSNHLYYHRDLPFLLNLSMGGCEVNLALDLAGEILDNPKYTLSPLVLESLVEHLRTLVRTAVDNAIGGDDQGLASGLLTRIVRLFHKMHVVSDAVSVPAELFLLIEYSTKCKKEVDVIGFVATIANPLDTLQTMNIWTSSLKPERKVVLSTLHAVLRKASVAGVGMGLSGSLLRIKQARGARQDETTPGNAAPYPRQSIWRLMYDGEAIIDK